MRERPQRNTTAGGLPAALPEGAARAGEADLSLLDTAHRTAWYLAACDRAGLDPAARPFALHRVAGREALVAVPGAVRRMAASRGIAVVTVRGPEATMLGGFPLLRAVCRATAPDGRAEAATATVPWFHPTRAEALCVARAQARATLSLLGIAALDESDLAAFAAEEILGFHSASTRTRRAS